MNNYLEFIKLLEGYYGAYKPVVKKLLLAYLQSNCKPKYLKQLFNIVIKSHTNTFKMPPDIAIMEKFLSDRNYDKYFTSVRLPQIEEKTDCDNEEISRLFNKISKKMKFTDNIKKYKENS